jgi:TonB family protein
LKNNFFFVIAIAVSIVMHLYLLKINFNFTEGGRGEIEIPVTFIPDARRTVPENPVSTEKQITLPDDKPAADGYYTAYNKSRMLNSYLDLLKKEIENRKFSPVESMYYGLIGNALVAFTITGDGLFRDIQIFRSSGNALLDETALNAVEAASGKVKRPAASGKSNIRVNVTVKYQYGL